MVVLVGLDCLFTFCCGFAGAVGLFDCFLGCFSLFSWFVVVGLVVVWVLG